MDGWIPEGRWGLGENTGQEDTDYFEEWSMNFEMFIVDIKNYESIKGCCTNSYQNVNSVVMFDEFPSYI